MGGFSPAAANEGREACRVCGAAVSLRRFPALLRGNAGEEARKAPAAVPGEGGVCYSHPDAAALTVCEGCGRFLCRDCDTLWDGEHLCLTCIHDRREVKREQGFVSRRVIYDNTALAILAVPIVFAYPLFFLGIVSGPLAMYYLIRYRSAPRGFVPRGKFRIVLSWIVSVLTVLASLGMIGFIAYVLYEGTVFVDTTESP